jgi:Ca2+-binding RTX toxin-like protein
MASVASAFEGVVSNEAASYFLNAIPKDLQDDALNTVDLSQGKPGEAFVGTAGSDYVTLGLGDRLSKKVDGVDGFDIVETGAAIKLAGTGFRGAILTGDKNIGATGSDLGDAIVGNSGNNIIKTGLGDDVASGGDGDDRLEGGEGDDTLFGDAGNDFLDGGEGDDLLHGGEGDDTLIGGEGDDSLFGDAGNDVLFGDAGNDVLDGMAGDDQLFGGAGNDTLFGGLGSDTLFGGAGGDTFVMKNDPNGGIDVIADFNHNEDIIDLSESDVASFNQIVTEADGQGNTIITLPDQTQFKLVGYTPDEIDEKFFNFI